MKHLCICRGGDPYVMSGSIALRRALVGAGFTARIEMEEGSCGFVGALDETSPTVVSCGGEEPAPLRLWVRLPETVAAEAGAPPENLPASVGPRLLAAR